MVYRARGKNIHWSEIKSERIADMRAGLEHLQAQGWRFSSVTIDGRKGAVTLIKTMFPNVPIQMCIFHQQQIVRRYLTCRPKTHCGIETKRLADTMKDLSEAEFTSRLQNLLDRYADFLKERNELGQFKHRTLRSAVRSLRSNLPFLFTFKNFPHLAIPSTTNSCDGSFAHWKNKVKIHRGLCPSRRSKMIAFLLSNP